MADLELDMSEMTVGEAIDLKFRIDRCGRISIGTKLAAYALSRTLPLAPT
jgi:hypothetical protein